MSYLEIVKKAEEELKHNNTPEAQEVRERANSIQAVKIYSHVLEDEIWLILDRSFTPMMGWLAITWKKFPCLKTRA